MKTLIYKNITRHESDQSIIDNLIRKGWEIVEPIIKPVVPDYDLNNYKLVYNEELNSYSIIGLTDNELQEKIIQRKKGEILTKTLTGYIVEPEGFVLGLGDIDRNLFTQMVSLIREALDLGLISNDTPQTITDIDNKEITLSTLRFRQIMVGYGMYYKNLWDQME